MNDLLNENDIEEMRHMPVNLEQVTLYTYNDRFLLEPHSANEKIRTNLVLHRNEIKIEEQRTYLIT